MAVFLQKIYFTQCIIFGKIVYLCKFEIKLGFIIEY